MAALLQATVVVTASQAAHPDCAQLTLGQTSHLELGDRLELVSNGVPQMSSSPPGVLTVATAPGPSSSFGGITTHHLLVTLTAVKPGTVTLTWEDCTGTAC